MSGLYLINKLADFTYEAYTEFMNLLMKKYTIMPFCQVANANVPYLILRHDIDASLEAALKMAKLEKELKIKSTYFVLLSHRLYNLHEKDSLRTLNEISALGHEIGLHYDIVNYESYPQTPKKSLENEVQMLERLLKKKIYSIACHNVSLMSRRDPLGKVKGYINVYNSRFCENYVSDSCRAWSLEDLSKLLELVPEHAQLLIHPFLWTETVCKRDAVLENLFEEVGEKNRIYKKEWLRIWSENPKVKAYDRSLTKLKRVADRY